MNVHVKVISSGRACDIQHALIPMSGRGCSRVLAALCASVQQDLQSVLIPVTSPIDLLDMMLPHLHPMRHVPMHQHLHAAISVTFDDGATSLKTIHLANPTRRKIVLF